MKKLYFFMFFLALLAGGCAEKSDNKPGNDIAAVEDTTVEIEDSVVAVKEKPGDRQLTVAVVGDIMMGSTYPDNDLTADDGASLFQDAAPILQRVDIAAGNLEGSLFDGKGKPKHCPPGSHCFTFKMPTRYVNHLLDAGFDFVSLANNHINDFGPEAKDSTQAVLKRAGLAHAGVSGSCPTAIVEKDGRKIGFAAFGFNPGMPSINNYKEVDSIVRGLREECDFVIVSFHGGGEGKDFQHVPHKTEHAFGQNRGDVEKFAHTAVDAGADLVYGHSPHVTRALELYNDHLIVYSLGNFCTPYKFNLSGVNGYAPIVEVTLNTDGTFADGTIHSFIQRSGVGPRADNSNTVARNMARLTREDFPATHLSISDTGKLSRK